MRPFLVTVLLAALPAGAQTISSSVMQVAGDHAWGYRCAVKQPLGSYSLGRSVYNISRATQEAYGSPDHLVYVDEHAGTAGIVDIGQFDGAVTNPGGMADFGDDGSIWFVYGARAHELPFDLARSAAPYDPGAFDVLLDGFVSDEGSTVPVFQALGDSGLLLYRNGWSSWFGRVTVRVQRYDLSTQIPTLLGETDLAAGTPDPDYGKIGIEQLWIRHDPRIGATAATWQWWQVDQRWFGSNPFVYTEDRGLTWKLVDGSVLQTPTVYADRTPIMVPFDHVALGLNASWHPRDIGWSPGGTPWITLPDGAENAVFWRWTGSAWEGRTFAGPVMDSAKPYACGTTRDYTVIVYSELASPGELYAIVSRDDGATWSEPTRVDVAPGGEKLCWIAFVQPADRYLDNAARFIYGHYKGNNGAKNYENSVRFLKVQIGPRSDFNGDLVVNGLDIIAYLNAWAQNDWRADFNDDGTVDTIDVIGLLDAFANER